MAVATFLLALSPAGTSRAATVTVDLQGPSPFVDATGLFDLGERVTFYSNGTWRKTFAGAFQLKARDTLGVMQNFLAFSLAPLAPTPNSGPYTVGAALDAARIAMLAALAENALGSVTTKRNALAFQLAVWEIVTEVQATLNLRAGEFRVRAARRGALPLAQLWLDRIASGRWTGSQGIVFLTGTNGRVLMTTLPPAEPSPVPLPAPGLLLGAALVGAAGWRRWRGRRGWQPAGRALPAPAVG